MSTNEPREDNEAIAANNPTSILTSRRTVLKTATGLAAAFAASGLVGSGEGSAQAAEPITPLSTQTAVGRFYVRIEAGGSPLPGEDSKGRIVGLSHYFHAEIPVDPGTGLPAGRRQYRPLQITKEVGAATPAILRALVTGQDIDATFEFVQVKGTGSEVVFLKLQLARARIVGVTQYMSFEVAGHDSSAEPRFLEDVTLTFGTYRITYPSSGAVYEDTWGSPAA